MRKKNLDDLVDREQQRDYQYQQELENEIYQLTQENKSLKNRLIECQQQTKVSLKNKKNNNNTTVKTIWRVNIVPFLVGFALGNSILAQRLLFRKLLK